MENKICLVIVILVVAGCVIAEDDDDLVCCPPSTYILNKACYDPEKNTTTPVKLKGCQLFGVAYNFTVKSGMIEYQISDLYKVTFGSDIACYGNKTKDMNLTDIHPFSMICIDEEERYMDREHVTEYCIVVSIVFLVLTISIYAIFGELRDLFGKSVINFCASMTLYFILLSMMRALSFRDMGLCAVRGFLNYFFLMASFFWSNSISIQVLRDTRRPSTADYGWREFKWYMLYSWGMPAILTAIVAIVNYHPGNHQKPGLGLNHCWFYNDRQEWYYVNSVVTTLLMLNLGIFIYIATTIWRFALKSTHIRTLKFKLSMTVRLIFLMGLPWLIEIIRSAVGGKTFIWFVLDMIAILQGFLVFLVLVVRKRVVKLLHQRRWLVCCSGAVDRWLAVEDDEAGVVQPTDVFLQEDYQTDGLTHD